MHVNATTILAGAAAAIPTPSGLPRQTPYFSLVRVGISPDRNDSAFSISNPIDEDILLSRLSVGRKFSADGPELIINLGLKDIIDTLYLSAIYSNEVIKARKNMLYCDKLPDNDLTGWWGDYDTCDWLYKPLTDFQEDHVLKLYFDDQLVDMVGDESDLKVNNVCGIPGATKDRTIIRKLPVRAGNTAPLASFGSNTDDCEWLVYPSSLSLRDALMSANPPLDIPKDLAPKVFVSQYVEGKGNLKYFELYNPGDIGLRPMDIIIRQVVNGKYRGGLTLDKLSARVNGPSLYRLAKDGDVFMPPKSHVVICNSGAEEFVDCDYFLDVITRYNGNDYFSVFVAGYRSDSFGGFSSTVEDVCGTSGGTRNKILVRKPTVCAGNPTYFASFGTTTSDCEWEVRELDDGLPQTKLTRC